MNSVEKIDPVMREVWRAKAANAKKYPTLAAYIAHLRQLGERRRSDAHVPAEAIPLAARA
jgi:hypothetical protein